MKAELRSKKVGSKTTYLKYWVPEADEICELSIASNKVDENGELTKSGKEAVERLLSEMIEEPEEKSVANHEKEMEFDPSK